MDSIFGGGDTPAPPPPPPPPTIDSGEVNRAATEERKRRSMAEGRASTMLTQNEMEDEAAPTARKKLLGS